MDEKVPHLGKLGDLYVYDTALRIGAKLGFLPQRIYLHTGTLDGGKRLGLDVTGKQPLWPSDLPAVLAPLRQLAPHEIEDVLCIYKDRFFDEDLELDDEPVCWPEIEPDDDEDV